MDIVNGTWICHERDDNPLKRLSQDYQYRRATYPARAQGYKFFFGRDARRTHMLNTAKALTKSMPKGSHIEAAIYHTNLLLNIFSENKDWRVAITECVYAPQIPPTHPLDRRSEHHVANFMLTLPFFRRPGILCYAQAKDQSLLRPAQELIAERFPRAGTRAIQFLTGCEIVELDDLVNRYAK